MTDIFSVKNRVVIVTGGAKGNGFAISQGFANLGAIVYTCDILPKKHYDENHFVFDIRDLQEMTNFVDKVHQNELHIDVLVNNVGVTNSGYGDDAWDATYDVNLKSCFSMTKLCLKHMKAANYGVIINITSLNSEIAFPNNPSYVTTKGALKQLTKAIARDYGQYNIRANNLGPGYIVTDMTANSYGNPDIRARRSERTMLGRWGTTEDLVGPAVFLASNASAYITGQDIYVDGGWLAKGE